MRTRAGEEVEQSLFGACLGMDGGKAAASLSECVAIYGTVLDGHRSVALKSL